MAVGGWLIAVGGEWEVGVKVSTGAGASNDKYRVKWTPLSRQ